MTLYVAAMPADADAAARHGFPIAHMAYRLGASGLNRARVPQVRPGDLMVLDDRRRDAGVFGGGALSVAVCTDSILRELEARRFAGLLADFERPPCPDTDALLAELSKRIPVVYDVQTLVPCTECGAALEDKLRRSSARFGRRGCAAEIIRPADARRLADTIWLLERTGYSAAFTVYPEVSGLLGPLTDLLGT